jgi:hypothetical protein
MDKYLSILNDAGKLGVKVKNTALDFTVSADGADLRFMTLQPMVQKRCNRGLEASHPVLSHTLPVYVSPDFSRYPFRAGSTLAELTE